MALTKLLKPECITLALKSDSKSDVLKEMMDLLVQGGQVLDGKAALGAVREREKVMTTGVGRGLALPHAKSGAVRELCLALGIAKKPIDFESLDEQPVKIIFLLMAAEGSPGPHIQALSRIARLTRSDEFCQQLLEAKSREEILEVIGKAEKPIQAGAQVRS